MSVFAQNEPKKLKEDLTKRINDSATLNQSMKAEPNKQSRKYYDSRMTKIESLQDECKSMDSNLETSIKKIDDSIEEMNKSIQEFKGSMEELEERKKESRSGKKQLNKSRRQLNVRIKRLKKSIKEMDERKEQMNECKYLTANLNKSYQDINATLNEKKVGTLKSQVQYEINKDPDTYEPAITLSDQSLKDVLKSDYGGNRKTRRKRRKLTKRMKV
jgi:chromosome segregation ATPase